MIKTKQCYCRNRHVWTPILSWLVVGIIPCLLNHGHEFTLRWRVNWWRCGDGHTAPHSVHLGQPVNRQFFTGFLHPQIHKMRNPSEYMSRQPDRFLKRAREGEHLAEDSPFHNYPESLTTRSTGARAWWPAGRWRKWTAGATSTSVGAAKMTTCGGASKPRKWRCGECLITWPPMPRWSTNKPLWIHKGMCFFFKSHLDLFGAKRGACWRLFVFISSGHHAEYLMMFCIHVKCSKRPNCWRRLMPSGCSTKFSGV